MLPRYQKEICFLMFQSGGELFAESFEKSTTSSFWCFLRRLYLKLLGQTLRLKMSLAKRPVSALGRIDINPKWWMAFPNNRCVIANIYRWLSIILKLVFTQH